MASQLRSLPDSTEWSSASAAVDRAVLGPQARKWGLLLPGAPEPRLPLLRRQDFRSVFQTALRGLSNRSIVVVGNYEGGPITAEPCRAKARPLRPRRSCFAPAGTQRRGAVLGSGGGAGFCPRVRKVYYDGHLSPYLA